MQVVVLNGALTEAEQDAYVRQVTAVYPVSIIEKLFLDVQDGRVDVRCDLHRFRNLRKDTIPNPID